MINKETIKRNFSRYAHCYDRYAAIQNRCAQQLISKVTKRCFAKILDIGCGTGNFTSILRDSFPLAEIKAIDISPQMIKVAKQKLKGKKVEFIAADAETFDFKEKFDLISSNAAFQWFQDLKATCRRYASILSQGGCILFSTFGPRTFFELNKSLSDFYGKDLPLSAAGFPSAAEINAILSDSFYGVTLEEVVYKEKYASLSDLLNNIKYCGSRGNGYAAGKFWLPAAMRQIEKLYRKNFNDIEATYQIFFCEAVR